MIHGKSVLFAVILSSLTLVIAQNGRATRSDLAGTLEPSDSVSGLATVVSVRDTAEGRFAIVRIKLVAHTMDGAATIRELDETSSQPRGNPIARLDLKKGVESSVTVRVAVPRDEESRHSYTVKVQGNDGSFSDLGLYFRVPSDDPDPCQTVGDYIQCPGQPVTEVQP